MHDRALIHAARRHGGLAIRHRRLAILLVAWTGTVAGCSLLPGEAPLLHAQDSFGDVPYAVSGWTSLEAIGQPHGPADGPANGRIYAMVTRDQVVLAVSPSAADGSTSSVIGRGACWTWPGAPGTSRASFGGTTLVPNP